MTQLRDNACISSVCPPLCLYYYYQDAGVRSRCQHGIGEGSLTKKDKLPSLTCTLNIEEEGGFIDATFWSTIETKEEPKKTVEEEEEGEDDVSDMKIQNAKSTLFKFRICYIVQLEDVQLHSVVQDG